MLKQKIFFVTGASTSGKTTIIPLLKDRLPKNFIVYDFDERGVPDNVTHEWRKKETVYWLKVGIKNAEQNKHTIVCGVSIPSEVAENKELLQNVEPQYLLLDVSSSAIRRRFVTRLSVKKIEQEWARTIGLSEEESVKQNIAFATRLRKICKEYKCKVFNTSKTTSEKTAAKVAQWIIVHT